jgi:hypothetical protein
MAPKFEEYRQVVDSYAKFLDATVTNFDSAEFQINSNASAFKKSAQKVNQQCWLTFFNR